jgi:hypothetical protein
MKTYSKLRLVDLKNKIDFPALYIIIAMILMKSFSFCQYVRIDDFKEVGAGNFFIHLDSESDLKRTLLEVIKTNSFPREDLVFNKGKNLFFAAYYHNPKDEHYTYFIYAEKVREGYDLYLLYIENTYHYFFDYSEGPNKYSLIFEPEKHKSKMLTPISGEVVKD